MFYCLIINILSILEVPLILFHIVSILQNIPRRALQFAADGIEGAEADGLGLARLEDGEVGLGEADALGQLVGAHLALGEHYV